ncbi:Reactive oxygen species modulator 1, partial [Phalacrocorax carbo]
FLCLRIGMRGRELMGGVGKTMMQSGGTFGTFMAIGMGIRC